MAADVQPWWAQTKQEILDWMEAHGRPETPEPWTLAFRKRLVPVEMYCYLKARFGEPNGFQTFSSGMTAITGFIGTMC
jgi:hypothetical protein